MPYQIAMQIPANAVRVRSAKLREEFKRGGCLQDLLLRCMHALFVQVAQSATCSSFHTVEERLCRWLLIARDHVQTDTLHLTQEFLSHMLGVTRTSVTTVAVSLQKSGLIGYSRGKITILDRRGLEAASCGCYRVVREEMARLFAA
jgi:CRP-like cAMP-binding protein